METYQSTTASCARHLDENSQTLPSLPILERSGIELAFIDWFTSEQANDLKMLCGHEQP